jgi:hypothetical protein
MVWGAAATVVVLAVTVASGAPAHTTPVMKAIATMGIEALIHPMLSP